ATRGRGSGRPTSGAVAGAPPQLSGWRVLAVWAAAAVPMGLLSWVVAPAVADRLDGPQPLARALLVCLTAGLVWQGLLVAILVRRELPRGGRSWRAVRESLWLVPPSRPSDAAAGRPRRGGAVWWWLVPFVLGFGAWTLVPSIPGSSPRDLGLFLESSAGADFFSGAWGWFAVVVVLAVFNTVLGEELLFRGYLLPRMQVRFGRADWLVNGVLFAAYHLHTPWIIPSALSDAVFLAYPTRRFRSAWMGIAVHSTQSVVIVVAVLVAVLR
uniref:CPBP family intramembrane glutamic endopeptidase n=1 Tax=Cellulomonas sp. HZM TaxID=1454010 RepID=UPI000551801E